MALEDLLGGLGDLANPFGAPAQGQWNLARGTYVNADGDSVVFFFETKDPDISQKTGIDQTVDAGGRRIAVYEYPYKDGQRLDDIGRRGFNFTFNIKFWGLNYQEKFKDFYNTVIDSKGIGTLTHPTLSPIFGSFQVRFRDFEFLHRYDEYNAITIKAVFLEDSTQDITTQDSAVVSSDSQIRAGLQTLVDTQAAVSSAISAVSALLLLPSSIQNAMNQRINSITGQLSRLFGQLGATFSSDSSLQAISQAALPLAGGVTELNSGTQTNNNTTQTLPPVFQVGFDPTTDAAIQNNLQDFVNANQITQQQAVFSANQGRAAITAAINEAYNNLGNYADEIVLLYRQLSVSVQTTVEAAISAQSKVILYTTTDDMSLRRVAFLNGLDPDRQNDIEALNPYLGSINFVPRGTTLVIPAA